jgi:hypothetical protein
MAKVVSFHGETLVTAISLPAGQVLIELRRAADTKPKLKQSE